MTSNQLLRNVTIKYDNKEQFHNIYFYLFL